MKVILLNSAYKLTGEAAHCNELAEELEAAGHTVYLMAKNGGRVEEDAAARKIRNVIPCWFPRSFNLRQSLQDLRLLRRLVREHKPDVVHCHRGDDHGLAAIAVAGLRHRPALVRTRHRVIPVKLQRPNRWLFLRRTDYVISVSQCAAQSFGPMLRWMSDRHSIIYSSADATRFNPDHRSAEWRASHGLTNEHLLVGLVARLQRVKGQTVFLQAAAKVASELPNVRFLISGSGPPHKMPRLRQMARDLGISDKVIFLDWLPEIPRAIASLDAGVLASLGSEGSSRITYEYMASGVPVIATSVGCIPEIVIDGETGYVVAPGDPDSLANAIVRTLSNPEQRQQLVARAFERFRTHYSRQRWVAETTAAYDKAIQIRRAGTTPRRWFADLANILRPGQVEAEYKSSRNLPAK